MGSTLLENIEVGERLHCWCKHPSVWRNWRNTASFLCSRNHQAESVRQLTEKEVQRFANDPAIIMYRKEAREVQGDS